MTVIRKPALVLIDLDGTLVNSVPDLAFCIDQTMLSLGLAERGEAAVTKWVGNGIERLVMRALTNSMEGDADEALFQQAITRFRDLYQMNNAQRSYLYDGVIEGLEYLRQQSYPVAMVTNKAAAFTHPLLDALGISSYFELVICGDQTARVKPDPLPLLTVAERLGADPDQSLMLGDSVSDLRAARAAGFQIICMSYGYNHGEDIRSYGPDAVIDSMAELQMLI